MKSIIIVFATLLLIIATPFVFAAIDDSRTEEYNQTFAGVTTGAGAYAANVTLGRAIYNNDTTAITTISSNITPDSPSVSTFNTVSRTLEVGGLDASQIRTLSVTYNIDSTILPDGVSAFLVLLRWFYIFIIVGMAGGAIYAFFD